MSKIPALCALAASFACGWIGIERSLTAFKSFISAPTVHSPNITLCPQAPSMSPGRHAALNEQLNNRYSSETFKLASYQSLAAAIRIPTESYDDLLPVGQDERWNVFDDFHALLKESFPLMLAGLSCPPAQLVHLFARRYTSLTIVTVNTYGLVIHWQGSNHYLKPILLTAHQDVVPVDRSTEDQWLHPPYSGFYNGTWIFGRGSVDDKADLVAQLITVNSLLEGDFKPMRTIVLAFGIDEEASGTEGAGKLAIYLEETYGANGFAMLLDEGEGYGENLQEGIIFARPGISEKGYLDTRVEVFSPGGHSSIPPDHTSIGILSLLIASIEANPHPPRLLRNGTAFLAAQCAVEYSPDGQGKFPSEMKDLARRAHDDDDAALQKFAKALFAADPFFKVMSRTTQAVDIVSGELKINALPERAEAVINHRIAEHSSSQQVKDHLTDLIKPLAEKHQFSLQSFGEDVPDSPYKIVLSDAFYSSLEPSPIAPILNNPVYDVLSGTIIATLQSSKRYCADGVIVSPSLGLGNTGTKIRSSITDLYS
ncbi:hypothetical protein D9757_004755 [Collybiopsis confluens]|uniref:Peptidase M20 dimerisation domain-containing protein n=1 Tax=Collybiopsis confluens TaxID=2823264 RepID=A0A8H5HSZ7_9AGAR|nr:hypothetical protein D9757_004755 [Collybiopsis confluens]